MRNRLLCSLILSVVKNTKLLNCAMILKYKRLCYPCVYKLTLFVFRFVIGSLIYTSRFPIVLHVLHYLGLFYSFIDTLLILHTWE